MDKIKNVLMPWTYVTEKKEEQAGGASGAGVAFGLIFFIIMIVLGFFAAFLCWRCNKAEDMGLRIIYTLMAFIYGIPYLLYYLIIRVLMGYPCKCCGAEVPRNIAAPLGNIHISRS